MPRPMDPAETFDVVLASDAAKPADARPTFVYRAFNGRQWRMIAATRERVQAMETTEAALDALYQAASTNLVDWRGMTDSGKPLAFNPADLDLVVGPAEAWELLEKMQEGAKASVDDAKKSAQPS